MKLGYVAVIKTMQARLVQFIDKRTRVLRAL
jgi:hypothetical protein